MFLNMKWVRNPISLINLPEILKSQTKRLNLVNNEQSNVNFVREMNTYYMYMKGWYYMYKERSWPLVK